MEEQLILVRQIRLQLEVDEVIFIGGEVGFVDTAKWTKL
jgi:hypothetical protein